MTVLGFSVTPANVADCKLFSPLISSALSSNISDLVKEAYGDNAYDTSSNREFCKEKKIKVSLHSKEETGKTPKNSHSAQKKSRKRSKIETLFGIAHENLGFGAVQVRGLWRVLIDTSVIFIGWNLGILYSFYMDRLQDRISLKRLLYKN
jgi:IS5 family transposase